MKMYFTLGEATHLRYLFPLARQFSLQGGTPVFLPFSKGKYNCIKRYEKILKKLASSINAEINWLPGFKKTGEIIFCVEGAKGDENRFASGLIPQDNRVITLVSQLDFLHNFYIYKECSESIIFPSNFLMRCGHPELSANTFEPFNPKNIAIGSPLYNNKKDRGLGDDEIIKMYKILNELGFEILVKNRGKFDNIEEKLKGDHYFLDPSWFPHDTMQLISISDLVINADSTAIKEIVMGKKPVINFDLFNKDAYGKGFDFLYKYNYCREFYGFPSAKDFVDACKFLVSTNLKDEFDKSITNHLFKAGSSSKNILHYVLN